MCLLQQDLCQQPFLSGGRTALLWRRWARWEGPTRSVKIWWNQILWKQPRSEPKIMVLGLWHIKLFPNMEYTDQNFQHLDLLPKSRENLRTQLTDTDMTDFTDLDKELITTAIPPLPDWNELFTTKCVSCGFPIEAGDRWVEALNNNYHSQCFNCSVCFLF